MNIDSDGLNDDTGDFYDRQQTAVVNDFGSGNTGPAPLQNDVIPDETFKGVVNVDKIRILLIVNHIMADCLS